MVSEVSAWEMAIKRRAGRWPEAEVLLRAHDDLLDRLGHSRWRSPQRMPSGPVAWTGRTPTRSTGCSPPKRCSLGPPWSPGTQRSPVCPACHGCGERAMEPVTNDGGNPRRRRTHRRQSRAAMEPVTNDGRNAVASVTVSVLQVCRNGALHERREERTGDVRRPRHRWGAAMEPVTNDGRNLFCATPYSLLAADAAMEPFTNDGRNAVA